NHPNIILVEPVGSCTDFSATVMQPLKHLHGNALEVFPLTVLLDPARLREALGFGSSRKFPDSVYYIFCKQLEEADAIVINKADLVSAQDLGSLQALVKRHFSSRPVLAISART